MASHTAYLVSLESGALLDRFEYTNEPTRLELKKLVRLCESKAAKVRVYDNRTDKLFATVGKVGTVWV